MKWKVVYLEKFPNLSIFHLLIFNLPFEIDTYHPITSNNCQNVVLSVLLLYSDTYWVSLKEKKPYNAQLPTGIIN